MFFNESNFKELSGVYSIDSPCVSIFIPTYRAGHVPEDKIRFKNALSEAQKTLEAGNVLLGGKMTEKTAKGFLTPAYDLLEDTEFWLRLSDGLAVFIGKECFDYFVVPLDFHPLVYVKNHFYLRPLLPLVNGPDRFFLLALSEGEVRFFEGHAHHISPVKIEDLVPTDFEEAIAADPEKSLQMHGAGMAATFHGQSLHKDQYDRQLEQYCRIVDDGLMKMLHDENAPLVVAGVDKVVATYKHISDYKNILEPYINGNVEHDDPTLLHEKAWSKVGPYFEEKIAAEKSRFSEAMNADKGSASILHIAAAAINGKVETLFLAEDAPILWGAYLEADNSVQVHEEEKPYSVCINNLAAVQTFRQGGRVLQMPQTEMPVPTVQANAVYRY